jgi:hypothetical protein
MLDYLYIVCVCVKIEGEREGRGVASTDLALQVWHPRRCVGPHGIVGRHYYLSLRLTIIKKTELA